MTKKEFADALEALLAQYSQREWVNWVIFGQSPSPDGSDTLVITNLYPDDLRRAFLQVAAEIDNARTVNTEEDQTRH